VGRASATIEVPGLASEAEALWYDHRRWPTFVDGLHHVARIEGDWPRAGARVVWDSHPGGRGRVVERVVAFEPRAGQTLEVEDERLRAVQRVAFTPVGGGVVVALELGWTRKEQRGVAAIVEGLFVRRPQRASLERTLRRFATELASERETRALR
jgi:polyketide cyclase/dehydrase/lipid transport protein